MFSADFLFSQDLTETIWFINVTLKVYSSLLLCDSRLPPQTGHTVKNVSCNASIIKVYFLHPTALSSKLGVQKSILEQGWIANEPMAPILIPIKMGITLVDTDSTL